MLEILLFSCMTLIYGFQAMLSMETILNRLKSDNKQHLVLVARAETRSRGAGFLSPLKLDVVDCFFGLDKLMKLYFIM